MFGEVLNRNRQGKLSDFIEIERHDADHTAAHIEHGSTA